MLRAGVTEGVGKTGKEVGREDWKGEVHKGKQQYTVKVTGQRAVKDEGGRRESGEGQRYRETTEALVSGHR